MNRCYFPHMSQNTLICGNGRPVLDVYRDSCRNVWGKLSSKVERLGLRLAPAMHALINIAAAEAV